MPKDCCGDFGSRKYLHNRDAVTKPLNTKMGVALHFVSTRNDATETGNKSKTGRIQEVFVLNYCKLMDAMLRVEAFNLMGIFMVPSVANKNATKPNDKLYLNDTKNLFLHWDTISWQNVCQ